MTLSLNRKNQIILAAIECISKYGYSNFSMQDLAQRADVSKGVIHYYFLNKEALMMAVLEYVCADIEKILEGNELISDPIKRLSHVIWMYAGIPRTKREYYKIKLEFWTQTDQKELVKKAIAEHNQNFRLLISDILTVGMEKKVFQKQDAVTVSSLILAMIDGVSLQWHFEESLCDYDELIKNCEKWIMKLLTKTSVSN